MVRNSPAQNWKTYSQLCLSRPFAIVTFGCAVEVNQVARTLTVLFLHDDKIIVADVTVVISVLVQFVYCCQRLESMNKRRPICIRRTYSQRNPWTKRRALSNSGNTLYYLRMASREADSDREFLHQEKPPRRIGENSWENHRIQGELRLYFENFWESLRITENNGEFREFGEF